ncbi:MAG: hypothetical protein ABEI99_09865, partial [Halobaculum sp.]
DSFSVDAAVDDRAFRLVAHRDEDVASIQRALLSFVRPDVTELRVLVHPTESADVPGVVARLDTVSDRRLGGEGTERRATGTRTGTMIDALADRLRADGRLPVTELRLDTPDANCWLRGTTSGSHVGAAVPTRPAWVADASEAVGEAGVFVPAETIATWTTDDGYVEIDTHTLCAFAEPVGPPGTEERHYVTHHCHDLRDLRDVSPDPPVIRLEWADHGLLGSVARVVFGRPPDRLTPPPESFDAVRDHLTAFVA